VVYALVRDDDEPPYENIYTHQAQSWGNAIAACDGTVFAVGQVDNATIDMLTVRLNESNLSLDTANWSNGYRVLNGGHGDDEAFAVWTAGTNVYVTGRGQHPLNSDPQTPLFYEYLTIRYSKDGTYPNPPFPDFYPNGGVEHDNAAKAVTSFCAGQVFVTGFAYNNAGGDYDAVTLLYAQQVTEYAPTSVTVDVGTHTGGNLSSLANGGNDNNRYTVANDLYATRDQIVVTVVGNVGSGTTELCFEVESNCASGTSQKIQLYNYDSAEYELVDDRPTTTTDRKLHMTIKCDPDKYISNAGEVKARILYYVSGPVTSQNWSAAIDQAVWVKLP
jgi:hypothetical protein